MKNRTKIGHFIYWLYNYIACLFFPRLSIPVAFRKDWMTWEQYKVMTNNLSIKLWESH